MALHADRVEDASSRHTTAVPPAPKNQPIQPGRSAGLAELAKVIGVVYVLILAGPWLKEWFTKWADGQEGRLRLLISLLVVALPLLSRLFGTRKSAATPEDATRPLTPV